MGLMVDFGGRVGFGGGGEIEEGDSEIEGDGRKRSSGGLLIWEMEKRFWGKWWIFV